jgi:hypothetical protein
MKGKWSASVMKDDVVHRLGTFETEHDAARAYNEKAIELFGEYAWVNDLT